MSAEYTVAEWAARPFRPCCGTCRAPLLTQSMRDVGPCGVCSAAWDGSEASPAEACYRVMEKSIGHPPLQTERDVHWLVKDFDILYRSALDVSVSIVEPERETPPQRNLRAQLLRLRPAFEQIQSIKAELRRRETP